MVFDWLKKLFDKKDDPTHKNNSTHTMGPEELIRPEEDESVDSQATAQPDDADSNADEHDLEPTLEVEAPGKSATRDESLRVMEAALFMASKGMNIEELGKISGTPLLKARDYLPTLVEEFNARRSALEIVEDVGGYRMKVRAPYDDKVAHLAGAGELSPAEMKTLAFIAYKQPLIQSQLVQVRSNTAYDHLQVLLEKGFVSREPKGRTYVLRTTKKFAEYFGAHSLKLRPMKKDESMRDGAPDHTQAEELS